MLMIDPRAGSKELHAYMKPYGIQAELTTLDFGDVCFFGNTADGVAAVGMEHKTLSDFVSSMRSKRLSGFQLPGLMETYHHVYLIVQGIWRCGDGGMVEEWKKGRWMALRGGVMYREVDHHFATLEHVCGLTVKETSDYRQSAAYIASRYKWWSGKEWHEHRSHESIYANVLEPTYGKVTMRRPGAVEMVASQLPGVDRKAWEFGKVYRTPKELANTDVKTLMKVEGIGRVGAEKIVKWWEGRS